MNLRLNRFYLLIFALILSANVFGQNYTARPNLEYASAGGVSLRLDLYTPNNQTAPTPLIIWIHGGGWQSGSRTLGANSPQLRQANRGYAVASLSYRLSGTAKFPAQIFDVKAAVRWLRANAAVYNLDPNKFAAWGGSAGGHLAVLLGTSSASGFLEDFSLGNANQNSRVQAVLDWFGPTDLTQMDAFALPCAVICHNCADSPESELIGCPLTVCRQKARRPNPLRYIDPNVSYPSFLIMHGTADCVVPPHQSQLLQNALTQIGAVSTLKYIDGAGHGGAQFTSAENLALVDNFFDSNLRGQTSIIKREFFLLNAAAQQ
jgi:acetyl esterase/lipase